MSEHKIAMVGTPCEIMAASKLQYYTDSPIDVKLGLFCMENFSYKYFENYRLFFFKKCWKCLFTFTQKYRIIYGWLFSKTSKECFIDERKTKNI